MSSERIHELSARVALVLAAIAFLTVLSGFGQPPQADEGTAAHVFQLSIVILVPTLLLFLATADWRRPWRSVRGMALPAVLVALAFGALYYLEHLR